MVLRLSSRKGFALPLTIFIITVLVAGLAAGLTGASAEYTANAAARGQGRAFDFAQTGLDQFVALRGQTNWCQHCGNPITADSEWTRVSFTGGYADVVAMKVRPMIGTSSALYFIRSTGVDTTVKLSGAGVADFAQRVVGVYATWNTATINVKAAWLSLSGLVKNGTGVISGIDQCGMQPSVAGVMVDKGDLQVKGGSFNPLGSPPVDTSNTFAQLKSQTNIDWAGILAGSLAADITIPGQSFPSGATFDADTTYWPVIRIHTNNYSLPNHGRGTIVADSDFTISGSNMWDGIVMVGGMLTSNGNNTMSGATLTGLNFLIGGTPSLSNVDDSDANGQKTYVYNSCSIADATSHLMRYGVIPNSWLDNLATW